MQVITAAKPEWIFPFTGLQPDQFRKLVRLVAERGGDGIADGRPGRQWALDLADRVLLVAAYWRTNLTMRQIGPLFGVSHSAAHRVIDTLAALLALAPVRKRPVEQIAIVDGTLVPTRDHRLAARSKNYRYSTNVQVAIDASTRLVIAVGDPQPGNRNDTIVYRTSGIQQKLAGRPVMADGAYRGNPEVIIPYRKPTDGSDLPAWKEDLNREHRTVRARVEHTLARMKNWNPARLPPCRTHIDRCCFRHRQPAQHHPRELSKQPGTGQRLQRVTRHPLGTVAQMIPAINTGVATSPRPAGYLACWFAAALASVAVSVATLVRRRPPGAAASAMDFALACALLVLGPLVLASAERFGTWVAYQPGYALSIIITASGVRSVALWAGGLFGVAACYVVYLGGELWGDMTPSAIGNVLTYVVYALIARMLFGYMRRIARDADASQARAAELARREEERRAQVMMHNGVAVMRLLTEPETGVPRSGLIDLAELELKRMRSYLRGRAPDGDESATIGPDGSGPSVALAAMIERVCDRFADLSIDTLLDLGAGLRLPAAQAEALERALESLLLNVRAHARAAEVVVHLDQTEDRSWTLTVRDDGVGFDPVAVRVGVGLREVVVGELRRCGLDVEIESAVGDGTTVTISPGPEPASVRVTGDASVEEAA